jgi:glycyl-tRNA synthetase beta chain
MTPNEFFLEVRCEEIPARMLQPGIRELGSRLFEELMGRNLAPTEVSTGFTPRRLVVTLSGLPEREPDRRERMTGPPAKVAYDEGGQPTKALLGFAERCGIEPQDVRVETTEKGDYLVADIEVPGAATVEVLGEIVPRVLASLSWPKSMRWGASEGPWVRPVHSIVALLAGQIVDFELFGIRSGDRTVGHPIHSPEEIVVTDSAQYHAELESRHVIVDFEARKAALLAGLEAAAEEAGGTLVPDDELLDKLASICGTPGVVRGDIEAMDLPREVLVTSLRDHQSAFTAEAGEQLLPCFLTVMDRFADPDGRVRRGNEWVVAARLDDARFFYSEDRKIDLAERAGRLEGVTFQERLGSYADKTDRIVALSEALCDALGFEADKPEVLQAARLLKADLTSEMVKEFTSLQGVVGGVYAREEGQPEAVWQAVYDQYLPASSSDPVPRGRAGWVVSLADRIDTLVGMFGCGLIPTGSKDPFGLRRVAQGAVRIVLEADLRFDLADLVARAVELYGERLPIDNVRVLDVLRPFLFDRMRYLLGLEGFAYDEIEAALAGAGHELPDLRDRVAALHEVRSREGFLEVVLAAKRIANILREAEPHDLRQELLAEPAERDLLAASRELEDRLVQAEADGDYVEGLGKIAEFAGVLDRFFVEVLVMDEDPQLRANRLALLQSIHRTLSRTARLTEMVVDRRDLKSKP